MNAREDDYAKTGRRLYKLTWGGEFWGRGGAIALSQERYCYSMDREGEGASALSSTYYAAWGNAIAQAKDSLWSGRVVLWLARAVRCAFLALRWSNFAEKKIGLENMTHGQIDVRGSILTRWRFYRKAEKCLRKALEKEDISNDSRALVLCKLGEVQDRKILNRIKGEDGGIIFGEAARIKDVENTTHVRVLKALGRHMLGKKRSRPLDYKWVAMSFLQQALEIAEREKFGDQVVKIKVLIKKAE